jgi:hypothetical protein
MTLGSVASASSSSASRHGVEPGTATGSGGTRVTASSPQAVTIRPAASLSPYDEAAAIRRFSDAQWFSPGYRAWLPNGASGQPPLPGNIVLLDSRGKVIQRTLQTPVPAGGNIPVALDTEATLTKDGIFVKYADDTRNKPFSVKLPQGTRLQTSFSPANKSGFVLVIAPPGQYLTDKSGVQRTSLPLTELQYYPAIPAEYLPIPDAGACRQLATPAAYGDFLSVSSRNWTDISPDRAGNYPNTPAMQAFTKAFTHTRRACSFVRRLTLRASRFQIRISMAMDIEAGTMRG